MCVANKLKCEKCLVQCPKGTLVNLTKAMALDHATEHIRVNCICPGHTETPMTNITSSEQQVRINQRLEGQDTEAL
jgi:NAD(P)-dependent dehydrogenase (short-subunit alcohol dehydrogenase family)